MRQCKIILTRGIQGSGKSTWAKAWVKEDPLNRIRYNNDDVRNSQGVYWPDDNKALKKKESCLKKIKKFTIQCYMESGYDIVVDNMNLNPNEWTSFKDIIKNFNDSQKEFVYTLEFRDFFIPVEECIARDALRPNPIGAKVIKETYRRYRQEMIDIDNQKLNDARLPYNPELPNCILADMDATLCFNTSGRPYFGEGSADKMYLDVPNDPVIKVVRNYLQSAGENDRVFIVTGREAAPDIRKATIDYVKEHVSTDPRIEVIMRVDKDYRKGDIVKKELYETHIKGKYNVDFVLDDSIKIVKMYRELGLTVLQPNEGKY